MRLARRVLAGYGNLTISRKLLVAFAALGALMVLIGSVGLSKLAASQRAIEAMYVDSTAAIADLGVVTTEFEHSHRLLTSLALTPEADDKQTIEQDMREADLALDSKWQAYVATDMRGREQWRDQFADALGQFRQAREATLLPAALKNRQAQFLQADQAAETVVEQARQGLQGLVDVENQVAKRSIEQAQASYASAKAVILAVLVAAVLLAVALAVGIGRLVSRPLAQTVSVLQGLAEGRLDRRLQVSTRDEVGAMGASLNTALNRISGVLRDIGANADVLASASQEMTSVSMSVSAAAEESAVQAGVVSAAAEQVSRNVQTVATGSEQMGASIREIAQNATQAAEVASQAVQVAASTTATVSRLGDSSAEIGNVVNVITSIAQQTNLLALNATIEAARAGEAGKGFAVVANEVKELAQETARATEDISRRVESIQADTGGAVAAIEEISTVIRRISDFQLTIASAVEQQTATTTEMSRNVAEAATASSDIAGNINGVANAAQETTQGASATSQAARELAQTADELKQLVGQFQH